MAAQLPVEDIRDLIGAMWTWRQSEQLRFNTIHNYITGAAGYPNLPSGADPEVVAIQRISIKNVLSLVRDSFAQNLSVVGYRDAKSQSDMPGWSVWQDNRMDARQAEIYRPALTYGVSYVFVTPSDDGPVFRPRSPRKSMALYEDPDIDQWPQYALETWIDNTDGKPTRRGTFYDDNWTYQLNLGPALPSVLTENEEQIRSTLFPVALEGMKAAPHNAGVCPVVRYVNSRDADDMIVGEIEPLIPLQRAINEVNFDRLVAGRWGAFPQKVVTGWSGTDSEVLKASARRVWTFGDAEVKASTLQPASMANYNEILEEMIIHLAMVAQISPSQVSGKLVNVSADALAAAEANQQRKLAAKRDSFGESHEQLLTLGAKLSGDKAGAKDAESEVVWRDTEARSWAAIVDGVTKLSAAGVPIEYLLPMLPGMTQQQVLAIKEAMKKAQVTALVNSFRQPGAPGQSGQPAQPGQPQPPGQPGMPGRQPVPRQPQAPAAVA